MKPTTTQAQKEAELQAILHETFQDEADYDSTFKKYFNEICKRLERNFISIKAELNKRNKNNKRKL